MKLIAPLLMLLVVSFAWADEKSPIELKVVLKSAEYTAPTPLADAKTEIEKIEADTKGKKGFPRVKGMPAAPTLDIELHLVNTSDKTVNVWVGGDVNQYTFTVTGPGVKTLSYNLATTREFRLSRLEGIEPGKSFVISVKDLEDGFRGKGRKFFFTEPGEYKISATYQLASQEGDKGPLLKSKETAFKVVDKK